MSDHNLSSDLDDLLRQLEQVDEPTHAPGVPDRPARLVVATDWTDAAVPLTVLKAFRAIVGPEMPVQLAFAVPHEPTERDAELVHVLLEGTENPEQLAGLEVVSFAEVVEEPYDSAVVPTGDAGELIAQVGGLIVRMHDLVRRIDRTGGIDHGNNGDRDALKSRLATFTA